MIAPLHLHTGAMNELGAAKPTATIPTPASSVNCDSKGMPTLQ